MEDVPLPADSVDVVISNCVVNLSTDKPAVFAELARVLKPGGRVGISDIVAEDRLSPQERAERGSYVGCIAGALSQREYETALEGSRLRGRGGGLHARGRRRHARRHRQGSARRELSSSVRSTCTRASISSRIARTWSRSWPVGSGSSQSK